MDTTRSRASSGSPYEGSVGFARAVRVGQHIAVSGTAPIGENGAVSPDPGAQARRCWEIALGALAELGGRPEDVIRTRHFVTDLDVVDAVSAVHGEIFGEIRPASTMVLVAGLLDARWRVEVEVDAVVAEG
ncbi:RidA family protein [Phycicoccus avicenniae]|uniref:RidA family protein n=1 Tax=Phycicoccus avicenniae TaxID=2828860 RepID=UPI003D2CBB1A